MKKLFAYSATLVALAILAACSPKKQAGVQDFPNTLQASTQAALFDLPTSAQAATPTVQANVGAASLAKIVATTTNADLGKAYDAYLVVPVYIHIANEAKKSLQALIAKLASENLPAHWQGQVDSLYVKTLQVDSTLDGKAATYFSLVGTRNDTIRIELAFFRTDSTSLRGRFFLSDPSNHNARIRIDYNSIGTSGDQDMTVLFKRDSTGLDKVSDPTLIRLHAIKHTTGRIVITGASYHPTFADSFWGNGPKVYGFQVVSSDTANQSVLHVAFANADSVGANFYTDHALNLGVLKMTTLKLRQNMRDSASWLKAINFCLDSSLSIKEALTAPHSKNLYFYTTTKTPDDFTEADLERYLDLNKSEILSGAGSLTSMRGLYYLIKIKQPLYLQANATLVGWGDTIPAGFTLPATAITDEGIADEIPASLATMDAIPN